MSKINISVPHNLGQEEAKKRIAGLIAQSRSQFGDSVTDLNEAWDGYTDSFSFKVMGFAISGKLDVQPAQVHIEIQLPLAALPFKSRVEKDIQTRSRALLA